MRLVYPLWVQNRAFQGFPLGTCNLKFRLGASSGRAFMALGVGLMVSGAKMSQTSRLYSFLFAERFCEGSKGF